MATGVLTANWSILMGKILTPSPGDVERYLHLRALSVEIATKIMKTIPRRALDEIGDALGIMRDGVLVFESMDMSSVLMDCCLYDWFEGGRNVVQRYAEEHPAKTGTEEFFLLDAFLKAKFSLLLPQSVVPGAGLHCLDVLDREKAGSLPPYSEQAHGGAGREFNKPAELFLMDIALSRTLDWSRIALATRTIPIGEFWMSGGGALPLTNKASALQALSELKMDNHKIFSGPGGRALLIVRSCLEAGVAGHVRYESLSEPSPAPTRSPRWPLFQSRRRKPRKG